MNVCGIPAISSGLGWLVIDLNSYFASCEQQERPELRGRPVAVAPVLTDTTCAIAASYPAKAFGIRTGTKIREARSLCPHLIVVEARPKLYVEYHHRILAAIERCIPIDDVMSIDEVACQLDRTQRTPEAVAALCVQIKRSIRDHVGVCLTSSIGAAANTLLAKLASDMQKPDGMTILDSASMPGKILHLDIRAISGIGPSMAERLRSAGIGTMPELWRADVRTLRHVWGGSIGARFHALLHGEDLPSPPRARRSVSHQHVLAPAERTLDAAVPVMRRLLARAAERIRKDGYYCRRMVVDIKWARDGGHWVREQQFGETFDTNVLTRIMTALWAEAPHGTPLRVGVTLAGLTEFDRHQLDLFEKPTNAALTRAVDRLNQKYGRGTVDFGATTTRSRGMTSKIAFQRVPELEEL